MEYQNKPKSILTIENLTFLVSIVSLFISIFMQEIRDFILSDWRIALFIVGCIGLVLSATSIIVKRIAYNIIKTEYALMRSEQKVVSQQLKAEMKIDIEAVKAEMKKDIEDFVSNLTELKKDYSNYHDESVAISSIHCALNRFMLENHIYGNNKNEKQLGEFLDTVFINNPPKFKEDLKMYYLLSDEIITQMDIAYHKRMLKEKNEIFNESTQPIIYNSDK